MTAPILVPETPDEEMLAAARDWSIAKYSKAIGNDAANGCYRAMLSARPEALKRLREAELRAMEAATNAILDERREDGFGAVWFRGGGMSVPLADALSALAAARKEAGL